MIKYFIEEEWFGIVFRDPVTALTNLLTFILTLWCFRKLRRAELNEIDSGWRWFFLFMGISALMAIVVHGFSYYTPVKVHAGIWIFMCLVQGLGITFAQRATVQRYFSEQNKKTWLLVPVIQFAVFAALLVTIQSYTVTKIHVAVGLVPLMVWYTIQHFSGNPSGAGIASGILVASLTAFIHGFKLSFSDWFNYNDISHVVICIALWLMCKGVLRKNLATATAE
ncbi:MAG: hypothetical protein FD123_24 [Bacteroidetes bacterium]|nr:MAG: hypothetical protein FD123_24 [Bacteroidota bacterium]